jgi:hypothetical protein
VGIGAAAASLDSGELGLASRAASGACSFSIFNDGLVSASLADQSDTLPVAWLLLLARRGCLRAGFTEVQG